VIVGAKEVVFEAHKNVLSQHSGFFAGCSENAFKEADSKEIFLSEDDPESVKLFLTWAYTGNIALSKNDGYTCRNAYLFADKICAATYANQLLDKIRADVFEEALGVSPSPLIVLFLEDCLENPYIRFVIDEFVWTSMQRFALKNEDHWSKGELEAISQCPGLAEEVMRTMINHQKKPWSRPSSRKGCHYHQHADGQRCDVAVAK
jgi:hypothetical protein